MIEELKTLFKVTVNVFHFNNMISNCVFIFDLLKCKMGTQMSRLTMFPRISKDAVRIM